MNIKTLKNWLSFRTRKLPVTTIVLHATAGSTALGAISTLIKKGFSYHYLIEDQRETDGKIVKCVPISKVAFHAGKSIGPNGSNVNNYSIGISFVNLNDGKDPYSDLQYQSAKELCLTLIDADPNICFITTHNAISPRRKTDPKNFPAQKLVDDIKKALKSRPTYRSIGLWK